MSDVWWRPLFDVRLWGFVSGLIVFIYVIICLHDLIVVWGFPIVQPFSCSD